MRRQLAPLFITLLVAIAAAGCSYLPMPKPETPAQTLAVVDSQFTALVETATEMRDAGELTSAEQERLTPIIIRGNSALTQAWDALMAGRQAEADRYVGIAKALLLQLRGFIQEREGAT